MNNENQTKSSKCKTSRKIHFHVTNPNLFKRKIFYSIQTYCGS